MSCCTSDIYAKKPEIVDWQADANVNFQLGQLLYEDEAETIPFDPTGWTLDGGIGQVINNTTTGLATMNCQFITGVDTKGNPQTLAYANTPTATIETLPRNKSLIYDFRITRTSTGFESILMKGILVLIPGVVT